jgi:heme/copper-type cytochrome/quinol oxidase subunit 3
MVNTPIQTMSSACQNRPKQKKRRLTIGLCWLIVMLLQVATLGFQPMVSRRFFCFGLFWHALDIVWIGVFTIVYLGAHL